MSITLVEHKIAGAQAAAASRTNTFTSPGQPANGNYWVTVAGCFLLDAQGQLTIPTPSGLSTLFGNPSGGGIGYIARHKVSDGADGVNSTASKSGPASSIALAAFNLSGVGALHASGENWSSSARDGLTVTTAQNITKDNCFALAVFFRESTLQGGSMTWTYSADWEEVAYAVQLVSPADYCEVYVAKRAIGNTGAPLSCTLDPSGSTSRCCGVILVYEPALSAPGAPTNLAAVAASGSQINLSWDAPANTGGSPITGYKIERETGVGNGWDLIVSNTGSTDTTRSDTGLDQGQEYNYRVSAINAIGTSSPSTADAATTDAATAPDPPTSLNAAGESPTSIRLTWAAPVDDGGAAITGYKIERETGIGGGFTTIVADTGDTILEYEDSGLSTGQEYNYKVSAINSVGTSTASTADAATTPAAADNDQLSQIAFAGLVAGVPLAAGAVLDRADRQHLLDNPRAELFDTPAGSFIAQQSAWYEQAAASL